MACMMLVVEVAKEFINDRQITVKIFPEIFLNI